jgi:hypothetical protein
MNCLRQKSCGSVSSEAKAQAARENGKRGGRPADPRIKGFQALTALFLKKLMKIFSGKHLFTLTK